MAQREKQDDAIRHELRIFITSCLEPLVVTGEITLHQCSDALCRTIDKVMQAHSGARDATFVQREGKQIGQLVERYVKYCTKSTSAAGSGA